MPRARRRALELLLRVALELLVHHGRELLGVDQLAGTQVAELCRGAAVDAARSRALGSRQIWALMQNNFII